MTSLMSKVCYVIGFSVATVALMTGCNSSSQPETPATSLQSSHDHPHGGHMHADCGDTDEVAKALAALSPADRATAERQRICPVTDELLGSMGTPIKVKVRGRDVFICCQGCQDALQEGAEEYLAKLPR